MYPHMSDGLISPICFPLMIKSIYNPVKIYERAVVTV